MLWYCVIENWERSRCRICRYCKHPDQWRQTCHDDFLISMWNTPINVCIEHGTVIKLRLRGILQNLTGDKTNIYSVNGLVPSGNKPLLEPVLTKIFDAICWPQWVTFTDTSLAISPWCRIYASTNRVRIGSDNDLSPIRRQAII